MDPNYSFCLCHCYWEYTFNDLSINTIQLSFISQETQMILLPGKPSTDHWHSKIRFQGKGDIAGFSSEKRMFSFENPEVLVLLLRNLKLINLLQKFCMKNAYSNSAFVQGIMTLSRDAIGMNTEGETGVSIKIKNS